MGFDNEGFLGSDSSHLVKKQFADFPDLFSFANDCSKTAMKYARDTSLSNDNIGLSIGAMFSRCVAQFQSALILAERGLTFESMVLGRALLETAFVLGALVEKKVTPSELLDNDVGNRRKIGKAVLSIVKADSVPEHYSKLETFVSENKDARVIEVRAMANRAGMSIVYDGVYRHLSHFAAHPSISAVGPYFAECPGEVDRIVFRPILEATPKALLTACTGIILACSAYEKRPKRDQNLNEELHLLHDRQDALYEKYRPWSE